ncbi:SGNH/GDSL hydrolase family protein [Candidatus Roizmanbacteria bacterium]|nr:SGNH/GDSL hydrolase family protein [Candidatus Roizmanbacteria bacterium]
MKNLFPVLIFVEIAISILLGINIFKKINILGVTTINSIRKDDIYFNNLGGLKYFYEPKPNIKQLEKPDWLGFSVTNIINNDTFNERYDYSIDKPQGVYRIITLGDSFTFGAHVNTENNWVELLEKKLNQELPCRNINKFEIINLGVPGYDIQYAIERYRQRGKKYNPDLILWFLKDDDFYDITEETQPIIKIQREKAKKEWTYKELDRKENLTDLARWTNNATQAINKKYGKKKILDFQKNLLDDFLNTLHTRLFIFGLDNKNNAHLSITEEEDSIIQGLIRKNRNFFYANHLFTEYDYTKDSFFPHDTHFNERGHTLLADELFHYLIQKNIITCKRD